MSTTIMQTVTFIIFIMSEKIIMLKFLPQMDTGHYTDSHFLRETKKASLKRKKTNEGVTDVMVHNSVA